MVGRKGSRTGLLALTGIYLLYMYLLLHPPRSGWDIILIKATLALGVTLLFLSIALAYAAIKNIL
jgi:hypothetical protein